MDGKDAAIVTTGGYVILSDIQVSGVLEVLAWAVVILIGLKILANLTGVLGKAKERLDAYKGQPKEAKPNTPTQTHTQASP